MIDRLVDTLFRLDGQPAQNNPGPDWSFLQGQDYAGRLDGHWNRVLWRAFGRFMPVGCRLLEVGCGSGKICVQASRDLAAEVLGVDVTTPAVAYARGVAGHVNTAATFLPASGFALPFADDSFDVVLSEGVVDHFTREQTARMVAKHARVCRAPGRVLISVPNLLNPILTYHKLRTGRGYHAYPERTYTIWGLARLLRRHGLRPIAYSGLAPTIGLEWFIHDRLRLRWLDRWAPNWLLALMGYELLVVAEKEV